MSTELKDTIEGYAELSVETAGTRRVVVFEGREGGVRTLNTMNQPDFVAAVEKELNGIFIDKADLPEVEDREPGRIISGVIEISRTSDPAALRDAALRYLAAAEYIEAHTPVDEQQVEALAQILAGNENWPVQGRHKDVARKVLASGKVTVSD